MTQLSDSVIPRLTSLAHGGGCGCKIAPGVLANLLKRASPLTRAFPDLLVGTETSDDAAVYRLNDTQAIVATTDFFMPIVDDPFDFGRIAATNALSDVYAMGGTPILALALVGMPINVLPHDVIARILEGGESVCADAGIPVAGGHSIDSVEPIYGLAALGIVDPARIARNAGARTGDRLILGKRLGVGILSAAFKKNQLDDAGYRALIATTTQLNRPGTAIATLDGVHAMTDVTGFGLLGHTLEMCRAAQRTAHLDFSALRWLDGVIEHASAGVFTGASTRNWTSYEDSVDLAANLPGYARTLLTDPQTSGGLLVACSEGASARVLDLFYDEAFEHAAIIGDIVDGPSRVAVT